MFSKVSYLGFTSSIEKITLHAKVFFQEAGAPDQFKCLPSSSANPISHTKRMQTQQLGAGGTEVPVSRKATVTEMVARQAHLYI